ncbi:GntR family transcriptional regulator [Rothia sp. P5766]|uniref:GntR family transcriptional regulator n=1 Tax=Rothia sp. P5766 TaxID=3402656 RepID=UPI003AD95DCE
MTSQSLDAAFTPELSTLATHRPADMQAPQWAASALRSAMDAAALTPGTQLVEEQLAALLDVSRNTLRQAFTELEAENLVQRIPYRGVFVIQPDAEQVRELFIERWAVESAAIGLAPLGENSDARAAIDRARTAQARGQVPQMASANQDFHRALVASARSQRLNRAMSRILAEMRLIFFELSHDMGFHAPFIEKNAELLALVEGGQREAAHRALRAYLDLSRDRFLQEPVL